MEEATHQEDLKAEDLLKLLRMKKDTAEKIIKNKSFPADSLQKLVDKIAGYKKAIEDLEKKSQ